MKKMIFATLALCFGMFSCVKDIDTQSISIDNIKMTPTDVTSADKVTVTASVITEKDATIKSVQLSYVAGSETAVVVDMTGDGGVYSGDIAAQADKTKVVYTITATNSKGAKFTSAAKEYVVTNAPVDYSGLVINEVCGVTGNKAVEIFNKSDVAVDLSGVQLIKNQETDSYATINPGNSIAAHGFAVIGADGVQTFPHNVTVLQTTGGMSDKQTLKLELKSPTGSVLDTFVRGVAPWKAAITSVGKSYARCPDGTGDFMLAAPTIGSANPASSLDAIPQI